MKTVYIETTIVSYYVARPSRDLLVLARQEVTREWWDHERARCRNLISPAVLAEARERDPDASRRRMNALAGIDVPEYRPDIDPLAEHLRSFLRIPRRKLADALHLAYVIRYKVEVLLTWNCEHLADVETQQRLRDLARCEDLWVPVICTPDQMRG